MKRMEALIFLGKENYEVKKVNNNQIIFTEKQLTQCKKAKIILISRKMQVIGIFSFNELKDNNYNIVIFERKITVTLKKDIYLKTKKIRNEQGIPVSFQINKGLEMYLDKNYIK